MHKSNSGRGFTIVEVALVLAVAGMIMLAIFIALPAVQRTERDAERQEDLAEIIRGIKSYQSNNRGALPSSTDKSAWQKFYDSYLPRLTEPNGQKYFDNLDVIACSTATGADCAGGTGGDKITSLMNNSFEQNEYKTIVVTQATCKDSTAVRSANTRKVALLYTLEAGGVICKNS